MLGLQPGQHVEAAQARHRQIRDDHVGAKPLGRVDERVAIAHRADDLEVVLRQQRSQPLGDDGVVVRDEDSGSAHHVGVSRARRA